MIYGTVEKKEKKSIQSNFVFKFILGFIVKWTCQSERSPSFQLEAVHVSELAAHRLCATVANGDCVEIGIQIATLFIYSFMTPQWICCRHAKNGCCSHGFNLKIFQHSQVDCWLQCCRIQCTINHGLVFHRLNGNEVVKLSLRFHRAVIE